MAVPIVIARLGLTLFHSPDGGESGVDRAPMPDRTERSMICNFSAWAQASSVRVLPLFALTFYRFRVLPVSSF